MHLCTSYAICCILWSWLHVIFLVIDFPGCFPQLVVLESVPEWLHYFLISLLQALSLSPSFTPSPSPSLSPFLTLSPLPSLSPSFISFSSLGFYASTGWDPATGIGSVDFVLMKTYFMGLSGSLTVIVKQVRRGNSIEGVVRKGWSKGRESGKGKGKGREGKERKRKGKGRKRKEKKRKACPDDGKKSSSLW